MHRASQCNSLSLQRPLPSKLYVPPMSPFFSDSDVRQGIWTLKPPWQKESHRAWPTHIHWYPKRVFALKSIAYITFMSRALISLWAYTDKVNTNPESRSPWHLFLIMSLKFTLVPCRHPFKHCIPIFEHNKKMKFFDHNKTFSNLKIKLGHLYKICL